MDADLLVIGAGIHGAAVAQHAAAAGHRVIVVEKTAPAAGTSSRSSKLIHGGLRYLEQVEFGLVRECLAERARLLRTAPTLVRLLPFHIPVYASARRAPWQVRAGLSLYSLLGGLAPATRFRSLPRAAWPLADGLDPTDLRALFRYQDAITDDAALTRAVLASAASMGTTLLCPAEVLSLMLQDDGVAVDVVTGAGRRSLRAAAVVNAAGPWLARVLDRVQPRQPAAEVDLVRGTHIELAPRRMIGAYYLESPRDARPMFVIPRDGCTLVGTTEASFTGDPDGLEPTSAEIGYLRESVAHAFPGWATDGGLEVRRAWTGVRVLPRGDGALNARSRETCLLVEREDRPRLLTIVGGKLTNHARTAAATLARLAPTLPRAVRRADPFELPLA